MKRFIGLALLSSLCLLCACGPKPWGYEEQVDLAKRPSWVDHPRQADTKTHMAFAGVSARFADEASARTDARLRAYEQAIEQIAEVVREVGRASSQTGQASGVFDPAEVREEVTRVMSSGSLVSQVDEYHVERARQFQGQATRYFYTARALVRVPRALVDQAMAAALERAYQGEHAQEDLERARRLLEARRAP